MSVTLSGEGGERVRFDLGSDGSKTKAMDRIHDLAISDDGRLAFVAAGLHLRCLDLETTAELWRHRPRDLFGFLQASPRAIGITKNKYVFLCNDNAAMDLFTFEGRHVARWRASDAPNFVSKMHNGDLFVGSDGIGITVWDPEDRRRVFRMRSSVHVYALKAFPKSDRVAVRSEVGVSVIDLFNGEVLRTWSVLPGLPYIDVSPDGHRILLGCGRGVAVYDTDGCHLGEERANGDRILTALFHPQKGHVVAGTADGKVVEFPPN